MQFSDTVDAIVAGATVRANLLAEFYFASETKRIWPGFGTLTTNDAKAWDGIGTMGTVDGLSQRLDLAAQQTRFVLSGVDSDIVAKVKDQAHEAKNRKVIVYLQFFDDAWKPLDNPYAISTVIMDQMQYQATGPDQRVVTVTAEGLFAARQAAPFAYNTDRDQQRRYPGDGFFKLMSSLIVKQVTWPS